MNIQFFKKEISFKKKNFVINPNLYWTIVLFCFFVLVLVSFIFGYRLFMQINQEPLSSTTNENGQTSSINKNRIEKVLNYFFVREKKSEEIINAPSPVVDPSL